MTGSPLVLVVDDDPRMIEMIQIALEAAGYGTVTASDATAAWDLLAEQAVSLVVLDVMMPGVNGVELCARIREHSDIPVILLTARGAGADRVEGLEAGADDYVVKPFSPRELVLRVGAILRRGEQRQQRPVASTRRAVGSLRLDAVQGAAHRDGRDLRLTPGEFRLLWLVTERPGVVVEADLLLQALGHESDYWGGRAALRTAVYRLRGKLETSSDARPWIVNEHGRGYRFDPP